MNLSPPPVLPPPARPVAPPPRPSPAAPSDAGIQPDPHSARGPLAVGLAAAAVLLLGLGGWAWLAAIDGAILAQGQIEASRTRLAIQHPEGGRIVELAVVDGQRIAAGDLVLRLDPGLVAAEREIVETQYAEALARQARLTAERDGAAGLRTPPALAALLAAPGPGAAQVATLVEGQRRLLAARNRTQARQRDQLRQRRDQARDQRDGLAARVAALAAESALVAQDLARHDELVARGLAPAGRLEALRRDAVRLAGDLAAARAEQAALDGRITEIGLQILALDSARHEEAEAGLRDLGLVLVELAARRQVLAERLARLELRAPADGRIHALTAGAPGAVLRPAEPAAELVPDPTEPFAAVRLAPQDVDRLHPGMPAWLVLPPSGGRVRPELAGRVTLIAPDARDDPLGGPRHVRVEIAIDPPDQHGIDTRRLPAGLPVEARIPTGSRSPLQWLVAPITAQMRRALRED